MTTYPVIDVEYLKIDYRTPDGKVVHAVRGLDLEVNESEVVGFIGPNGAGKSTAIKALMGFRKPTSGDIRIFGKSPGTVDVRRRIGFLPEVALYYPFLTARETLRMYAKLTEVPRRNREEVIDGLLEKVGLSGRDREPVRGFSKGMLQRVGIAQAIMGEPDLLILDEVTSGLDPVARYDVRSILMDFRRNGKTVFFSSHELSEVTMLCDRVILIDEGKVLVQGRMAELLQGFRQYRISVENVHLSGNLPLGIKPHSTKNGHEVFLVDAGETHDTFHELVSQSGGTVVEEQEQAGSLEDYFVHMIGRKVS